MLKKLKNCKTEPLENLFKQLKIKLKEKNFCEKIHFHDEIVLLFNNQI